MKSDSASATKRRRWFSLATFSQRRTREWDTTVTVGCRGVGARRGRQLRAGETRIWAKTQRVILWVLKTAIWLTALTLPVELVARADGAYSVSCIGTAVAMFVVLVVWTCWEYRE